MATGPIISVEMGAIRPAITVDFPRTVNTGTGGEGGGVTDHGQLTGLGDDDHSQYHNNTRGDARYPQRSNNLSDLGSATTARTNLGVGTSDTPTFAGIVLNGWRLEVVGEISTAEGTMPDLRWTKVT